MPCADRSSDTGSCRTSPPSPSPLAAAAPADAAVVNWLGGSSFWDIATNWGSNPLLPALADDVVINVAGAQTVTHRSGTNAINSLSVLGDDMLAVTGGSLTVANAFGAAAATSVSAGTLTLNGVSSMLSLAQSGGTLGGTGQLTIAAPSSWLAGTQTGSRNDALPDAPVAHRRRQQGPFRGRTVELNGTTTWSGNTGANNNALQFAGGTLNNAGTFNDQNTFASFIDHSSGTNAFNNIGTYNKQANTVTTVEAVYNNTGTTNVNAGTMLFQGTSTTSSTGVFNIAAGATLEFRNGSHTLNQPTIQGPGTFAVSSENVGADAVVTLNGGTLTSQFLLSGSTITGTDRTFQGTATWTGGSFSGTAVTTFANDVTISGPNTKTIVGGGTVNLQGTTTWAGNTGDNNNAIQFWNGATINNNGTFNDANTFASFIEHSVGGPHNFNNIGTYNKQANTITTVDGGVAFNNSGVVNVNAGTMRPSGGTSTGTFNIAAGAVLDFRNGDNVLNGATTQGLGTLAISSDLVGADAVVTINGGTHSAPLALSGSTLAGDAHTFTAPATWTGGTIAGAGTTTFANDVTISGAATKTVFGGRTLNLDGTTTWSGNTAANNNAIQFWNGATINNRGTFNDANAFASFFEHVVGGPHAFNNLGTYNKLSNTVTTVDLGVGFNNSGTLNLDAGTMRFVSGTQGPTGTVRVASGATYQHDVASTMGTLVTAGTLNLGTDTLTVFRDYDNANFGSGNAFNRRANVVTTGTGNRLIAGGDANQGISGATVTNGNTATPTIVIGNVHVGSTTYTYNIANTGTTGPALRGAIQTSVNGGNITDPRLSGSGVSAGNWGPIATGASLARDVVVTVGAAGSLAPLTGQSVAIVNNFDNTRSQVVTFGLAPNAAAYRLAEANTLAPISFGNVHVGDVVSQALTISNLAPNDGFSERLNASFGSANDARITSAAAVNGAGARIEQHEQHGRRPEHGRRRQRERRGHRQLRVRRRRHERPRHHCAAEPVARRDRRDRDGRQRLSPGEREPGRAQPGRLRQRARRQRRDAGADDDEHGRQRRLLGEAERFDRRRHRRRDGGGLVQPARPAVQQQQRPRGRHRHRHRRCTRRHGDDHARVRRHRHERARRHAVVAADRGGERRGVPPREPGARAAAGRARRARRRRRARGRARRDERVARHLHRAAERELRRGQPGLRGIGVDHRPRRGRIEQCARRDAEHRRRRQLRRQRGRELRVERRRHHRRAGRGAGRRRASP